jgi:hypothetical protein
MKQETEETLVSSEGSRRKNAVTETNLVDVPAAEETIRSGALRPAKAGELQGATQDRGSRPGPSQRVEEVRNLGRGGRLEGVQPTSSPVQHSGEQHPV